MRKLFIILFVVAVALYGCTQAPSENAIQTAIAGTEAARGKAGAEPEIEKAEPTAQMEEQVTNTPTVPPTDTPTPTPSFQNWFTNEVDITSCHLFEAGEDPSNVAFRDYANVFTQADARVIYAEINLEHPGPKEDTAFVMDAAFYGTDGEMYGEVDIQPVIKTGWTMSNWIIGYGWDDPGNWDAGSYRVDVLVGDEVIASDTFEIIEHTPTPEFTLTPTPRPGAVVNTNSLNIRSGPDTVYSIVGSAAKGDKLAIEGQAYGCGWLKIKTTNGVEGWVSSELVDYELPCSQIPAASIPPTPIPLPTATATKSAPQGKTVSIKVINDTGGTLSLSLSGPASYSFNFPPGNHTMQVLPGTYTYTAWGCGTSVSGTQKLSKGFEWSWYCK